MALPLAPSHSAKPTLRRRLVPFARPLLAVELGACQIIATSQLFLFEAAVPAWPHPAIWLHQIEWLLIATAVAFAVLSFPRRVEIAEMWRDHAASKSWRWPLAVNLLLFVVLTVSTIGISLAALMAPAASPPWHLLWLYFIPVLATGASLVWLAAPVAFWRTLVSRMRVEIAAALGVGVVLLVFSPLAREGWQTMVAVTLDLLYRL